MIALTGWFLILSANSVRDRVRLDDLIGGHTVSEAMEADPLTVTPTLTVDTFASQLLDGESPLTAVPVVESEEIVGVLGVRQVRRHAPRPMDDDAGGGRHGQAAEAVVPRTRRTR